jgi:tetratricopeptide (TPR) repeat protein
VSWGLNQQSDARRFLEDSVRLWREIGGQESLAQTLNHLGELLRGQGDYAGAQHCFLEALRVAQAA